MSGRNVAMRCLLLIACTGLALGGCATIQEDQCPKVDWYELGVKDGRAGYGVDRLSQHREACAGVKVEPDELRYLQGRKAGLAEYCQPENAFRDGLAGNDYHGTCDATFARNHRAAYQVATLRKEIESNRSAVAWREAEIRGDKASDSRRAQLRNDVRELDRKREALRTQLVAAERELDRLRAAMPVATATAAAPAPPPTPKPPAAVPVGTPGTATGKLAVAGTDFPLRFAYTFVAPDPLDKLRPRAMLLLSGQVIPPSRLGEAADLDAILGELPYYVLAIRNDGKPVRLALIVWHPKLGHSAAVETDVGRFGTAKFAAYGSERIAGELASPQGGRNPYPWNKAIRLDVKFDAPLVRRWED